MTRDNGNSTPSGRKDTESTERVAAAAAADAADGDEEVEQHRCGFGSCCSPDCSQRCHNSACLLITLSFVVLLQATIAGGYVSSSVTTLEKRFSLSSTQIGLLSSVYDVGVILVLIPVTYLGGKGHKGRWIGAGALTIGIGSIIFALPQFLSEKYSYTNARESLCAKGTNDTDPCSNVDDSESGMLYVFLLAQIVIGVGGSPLFTIALVYLDDNSSKGNSAVLVGTYYGVAVLGAAVGYLTSGVFLGIYGDFYRVDDVVLEPEDQQWYGAWWLGFVLGGILICLAAVPLFAFANHLPGSEKHRSESSSDVTARDLSNTGVRDLCSRLCGLIRNPTYMLLVLADSVDIFLVIGFALFMPKYIENMFHVTAGQAAVYTGLVVVPSGFFGAVLGGVIIKKLKLSTIWVIRFGAICFAFALPMSAALFLRLDSLMVFNVSTCNRDCECWNKMYDPVCDPSGDFQFFSPCHAGCTVEQDDDTFSNCACIPNYGQNTSTVLPAGDCQEDCTQLGLFLGILFLLSLFMFLGSTPNMQGILRCVEPQSRSLATGFGWVISRILGTLPGPIIFGVLIDGACEVWTEDCDDRKNCLVYDNNQFRLSILIVTASTRLVSLVLTFLASVFYKPGPWDTDEMVVDVTDDVTDRGDDIRTNGGHDNKAAVVDDTVF